MDGDRSWQPVGKLSIQPNQDDGLIQVQVARSIRAVAMGDPALLPELVRSSIVESILNAIHAHVAAGQAVVEPVDQSPDIYAVQVEIHLEVQEAAPRPPDASARRWGFFLVQKPGRPAASQLLLDLYLYQE